MQSPCQTQTIGLSDLGLASKDNLLDLGPLCKMDCMPASSLMWLSVLLHCLLTPISLSQTLQIPKMKGHSFSEVVNRTNCQPRWALLNLMSELPQFSDYIFVPSCVSVLRCSGCCLDEAQKCFPLKWNSVKMEVYKKRGDRRDLTVISVLQHTECECRPRDSTTEKPARMTADSGVTKSKKWKWRGKKKEEAHRSVCPPCDRRKILNADNCTCICQKTEQKCHRRGMVLNEDRCRCQKRSS